MNRTFIMRECLDKALWLYLCLSIAGCAEDNRTIPLSADSGDIANELVLIQISLTDDSSYHSSSFSGASIRNYSPSVAEWVGVKTFPPTRAGGQPDYESSRIASMELTEDTLPCANTRVTVPAGVYFRLIVFRKPGNDYVSQSTADYTSSGTGIPTLKQRKLLTRSGTIHVVGYSFNTTAAADLGTMPTPYIYNGSTVSIPDMSKDFMTFDSGDITSMNNLSHNLLPVNSSQELCKLTIIISPTGFPSNTTNNCTGIYVKQGGNSASQKIGPSSNVVATNTNNAAAFSPDTTLSTTIRMVPFAGVRMITVHFNTLTIGGRAVPNNTKITSAGSVQLKEGKNYTMKTQFKRATGINVSSRNINLAANGYSATDKTSLAELIWGNGNLKGTGSTNYVQGTYSKYGYYCTWYSTCIGSISTSNADPCTKLKSDYGTGWRTSNSNELTMLSRCTNKTVTNKDIQFMNNTIGLFLPGFGFRNHTQGSYTSAETDSTYARYWSSDSNGQYASALEFGNSPASVTNNNNRKASGLTVRCVKNK